MKPGDSEGFVVSPGCTMEDHGDAFFLVIEREEVDVTVGFSAEAARALLVYLARRFARRGE